MSLYRHGVALSVVALLMSCANVTAWAASMPGKFVQPDPSAKTAQLLPDGLVQTAITAALPSAWVSEEFAGRNAALAEASNGSGHFRVAQNLTLEEDFCVSFAAPFEDAAGTWWHGAVFASADATMLRMRADISALPAGSELWVVSLETMIPQRAVSGSEWLPIASGSEFLLLVGTSTADTPMIRVLGIGHFYRDMMNLAKAVDSSPLACHNDVTCDGSVTIRQLATGIGLILAPDGMGYAAGSGCLLNAPDTAAEEPFFLTANHVLDASADPTGVIVLWDFKTVNCSSQTDPVMDVAPRNYGVQLLETSSLLDGTFVRLLDTAPAGQTGRHYFGWTTDVPAVSTPVLAIHHPLASWMRYSTGQVSSVDISVSIGATSYLHETGINWLDGVTEQGSSGCPLIRDNSEHQVIGMLSGGPAANCNLPSNGNYNMDYFASFRDFYPGIEEYLGGQVPAEGNMDGETPEGATAEGQAGEGQAEGQTEGQTPQADVIDLRPRQLDFGTTTYTMTFTISSSSGQPVSWVAKPQVPWISISPATGSTPAVPTVEVDRSQLTPGTITATIKVTSGAEDEYVSVLVTTPKAAAEEGEQDGQAPTPVITDSGCFGS